MRVEPQPPFPTRVRKSSGRADHFSPCRGVPCRARDLTRVVEPYYSGCIEPGRPRHPEPARAITFRS
jgi:hypothetical protein